MLEHPSRPGRLDGASSVEQIAAECRQRFGDVPPGEVGDVVTRLVAAGFARGKELQQDVKEAVQAPSLMQRLRRLFSQS